MLENGKSVVHPKFNTYNTTFLLLLLLLLLHSCNTIHSPHSSNPSNPSTIGACVKDMEAAAIAWVAETAKVPFFALKVVTDIVDGDRPTQDEFFEV